jgi:hypothetical protein
MAQTKTRTQKKSSSGRTNSGSSKKGTTRKAASRSKSSSRAKSGSTRSRNTSRSKSSGTKRTGASRKRTSASQARSRQQRPTANSGGVLEKVKGPATIAGVALIGVAGGIAAVRNGSKRRSGLASGFGKAFSKPGMSLPSMNGLNLGKRLQGIDLPKSDGSTIGWVEEKARGLGDAGHRVADLTAEARRMREGGDS